MSVTLTDNKIPMYISTTTMYGTIDYNIKKYCVTCNTWTWQAYADNCVDTICTECDSVNDYFIIPKVNPRKRKRNK